MDRRDLAAGISRWYTGVSYAAKEAYSKLEDEDGVELGWIPVNFEICPTCDGCGEYVNPSIDAHGITPEEFARDWDPDDILAYKQGRYNITCASCDGNRVVPVPEDEKIQQRIADYAHEEEADMHTMLREQGIMV